MLKKTEQVAWVVLLLSFLACIGLSIGVPLSLRWYILNVTRPLNIRLQPRDATVTRQTPGSGVRAIVAGDTEILPHDRLELSNDAAAFLLWYETSPDNAPTAQPLITVQCYGATDVTVEDATTPNFAVSRLPHHVTLRLQQAVNARITVEGGDRAAHMRLITPHGIIELDKGAYTVVVTAERVEFSVTAGQATIADPATGDPLILTAMQRTELTAAGMGAITIGERDILRTRNGDFEALLEDYWHIETSAPPEESDGTVRQIEGGERKFILFERFGLQSAQTGIVQEINQDIRGVKSLRVRARIRVDNQNPAVCGSLGTECPVMLRITFTDLENNSIREWIQGFYAMPGNDNPFCYICDWKAEQIQVAQTGVWFDYESPDLLPLLRAQNIEPASVKTIKIYASGHTYGAAIDDIAILVGE
ncbi:MAG: hypothetical protein JXA33_00905 [Anaerolineae bacterium]|nr:hypothetical protein [Anaerolineae bacterium]